MIQLKHNSNKLNKSITQKLQFIQNSILHTITKVYKMTSVSVLKAEAGIFSIDLTVERLIMIQQQKLQKSEAQCCII